jgi:PAS domain S-box-containing protein
LRRAGRIALKLQAHVHRCKARPLSQEWWFMKKPENVSPAAESQGAGAHAWHEGDERFRKIIEHAPMAMAIVGMDGLIEYINRKAIEIFGYLPEDIPTMEQWWVQAYPDESYRREVMADWMGRVEQAIAEGHEIKRGDYRVTCKDGTVKTTGIFGMPVVGKVVVMFDDITERQQLERQLHEAEAKFRAVLETSLDVAYRRDLQRDQYDYISPAIESITGITVGEFCRMSLAAIMERIHPDDHAEIQRRLGSSAADAPAPGPLEYRFKGKDGAYRWLADSVTVVKDATGTPRYHVGIVRDISERKQMELRLRETERRITAVLNASTEPIMLLDRQGHMLVLNEAMARRIGKPAAGLIGQHAPSLHPLAQVRVRAEWLEQVFLSGQPVRFEDERNGRYFDNSLYPVLDQDGRVTTVAVYVSDMTDLKLATLALQQTNEELERRVTERTVELKSANQALRDGEARFRALFEQAGVGVVLVDSHTGRFVQVNQKCCDFVGYTPEEMRQLNFQDITHPEDLANDLVHAKLLNEGRIREFSYEKRYYHKSGRIVWGLLSMTPLWLPDEPPQYRVAVVEDITARKLVEQRLREANAALEMQATQLRELAAELTLTEQRERQRVAGVLHDDLQQLLIVSGEMELV